MWSKNSVVDINKSFGGNIKTRLGDWRAPLALLSLVATVAVCVFQLRCSSRWTPRYFTLLLGLKILSESAMYTVKPSPKRAKYHVLHAFKDILLALSQQTKTLRSALTLPQSKKVDNNSYIRFNYNYTYIYNYLKGIKYFTRFCGTHQPTSKTTKKLFSSRNV